MRGLPFRSSTCPQSSHWTLVPVSPHPSAQKSPLPFLECFVQKAHPLIHSPSISRQVSARAKKGKLARLGLETPPPDRWDLEGPVWNSDSSDEESDRESSTRHADWKVPEAKQSLKVVVSRRGEAFRLGINDLDRPMTEAEIRQEEERLRVRRKAKIEERMSRAEERRAWKNRKRVIQLTKKGTYKKQARKKEREVVRAQEAVTNLAALKEALERRQKVKEEVEAG